MSDKKIVNEKIVEILIMNITNAIYNQLILPQSDFQMVKDTIREMIMFEQLFNFQVGYNNIFNVTIDFSDFINRCIKQVLTNIDAMDKKQANK